MILGNKLDINKKRNDSEHKNPTSDVMTSRDVTMTSSPIFMIKCADLSTFLAPGSIDMDFFERGSKNIKNEGSTIIKESVVLKL